MPEIYVRHSNSNCAICGLQIYRRPSVILKNKGNVYCSLKCRGLNSRKEKPCVVCGKMVMASFNKKTCSRKCSNIHRIGIKYKIGSPNDIVVLQAALKRRLCSDRGAKCERCGYNKPSGLEIHHKDRNRKNSSLSNLELICSNCHSEEHYGGVARVVEGTALEKRKG